MADIAKQNNAGVDTVSITAKEMERRRGALRQADSTNRLEGIYRNPATDSLFEASIRGDIDFNQLTAALNASAF